ncbi:MAG: protein-L-isoaspartate(D-aspartate) O-methyltransferase [Acetobacteraceae bacterium]
MEAIDAFIRDIEAETRATAPWTGRAELQPRVLLAMRRVRRDQFVPQDLQPGAWRNRPLPIGHGQTISQPFIVALMTDLLDLRSSDRVLEIGTGSGYQAAVLAELADGVFSVETLEALSRQAGEALAREGYGRVALRVGDGNLGWAGHAPFDAIMVTAAAPSVPQALLDQLKPGGRMVIPVGKPHGEQELRLLCKNPDGSPDSRTVLSVAFVPLIGG